MREHLKKYIEESKTPSVRGLRILLEYFYALEIFQPIMQSKTKMISVFGSARTKQNAKDYLIAKSLGKLLYQKGYSVLTGASQGIMQAANEGVSEGIIEKLKKLKLNKNKTVQDITHSPAYKKELCKYSAGLKITLPFEPDNNPYIGIVASFHYFMVRKFFFGSLSDAYIACEGGWGTRDELFEMLTLVQTGKTTLMPIIYISKDPHHIKNDLDFMLKHGYISQKDTLLFDIVSDYKKAVKIIDDFYSVVDKIFYDKNSKIRIHLSKEFSASQLKSFEKLIDKKYKNIFYHLSFNKKKILIKTKDHISYGYLREIINYLAKLK